MWLTLVPHPGRVASIETLAEYAPHRVFHFERSFDRAPRRGQGRLRAATGYQVVEFVWRRGSETRQCQMTAWKASACGVKRVGADAGKTTATSACIAANPSGLPRMARTAEPVLRANSIARMRLTLIPRDSSPPPTDNTRIASFGLRSSVRSPVYTFIWKAAVALSETPLVMVPN